jgi:uncharacterized protein YoxC
MNIVTVETLTAEGHDLTAAIHSLVESIRATTGEVLNLRSDLDHSLATIHQETQDARVKAHEWQQQVHNAMHEFQPMSQRVHQASQALASSVHGIASHLRDEVTHAHAALAAMTHASTHARTASDQAYEGLVAGIDSEVSQTTNDQSEAQRHWSLASQKVTELSNALGEVGHRMDATLSGIDNDVLGAQQHVSTEFQALASSTRESALAGYLQGIHAEVDTVRERTHQMIESSTQEFQNQLLQRFDRILDELAHRIESLGLELLGAKNRSGIVRDLSKPLVDQVQGLIAPIQALMEVVKDIAQTVSFHIG